MQLSGDAPPAPLMSRTPQDVPPPRGALHPRLRWISQRQPAGTTLASEPPRTSLLLAPDIAFLLNDGVNFAALWRATQRARGLKVSASACLIASGAIAGATYAEALARHLGAALVTEAEVDARTRLGPALRQGWCRARLADGREVLLLASNSIVTPALLGRPGRQAEGCLAVAHEDDFAGLLRRHFTDQLAEDASTSVPDVESARNGQTESQRRVMAAGLTILALALLVAPLLTAMVVPFLLGWLFLGAACVHLGACFMGHGAAATPSLPGEAALPRYSVLVPLYNEVAIIDQLLAGLAGLDYPPEKLQILIVLEEHDRVTRRALAARNLPAHIHVFLAPPGQPRTKPRALNAAMPFVTGEFLVVFDAEDRPDPQQLRKAVAGFAAARPDVACLQARLAIDNTADSVLTRLFTIEYAALFDVTKAGTARLGLPVPLGGTSNHFRTSVLRQLGLWDAWNVTEDADLGLRLARHGYLVDDLDSTTDEEAPAHLQAWMAQRTRWLKGWMQTVVTHSRHPAVAWRAMGTGNFLAAIAVSAGVIVGAMFAPLFQVMAVVRALSPGFLAGNTPFEIVADALIVVLGIAGLLTIFVPAVLALYRRRLWGLMVWLPLLPAYHLLSAAASWRALYELISAPHRWNKTQHGLARSSRRDQKQ